MVSPETIETLELKLDSFITEMHERAGLNYWLILRDLLNRCCTLQFQADAEFQMKVGGESK